jgi:transposase
MTRPYSVAFKERMVRRLTGKNAVSASQLARETGVRQQNLSRWLQQARSLPLVAEKPRSKERHRTVEEKARTLAEAAGLSGEELAAYLERTGVRRAEYEGWRIALEEGGSAARSTSRRMRKLERELARKEKALAEAAALLVLKKKVASLYGADEDDDMDEENGK